MRLGEVRFGYVRLGGIYILALFIFVYRNVCHQQCIMSVAACDTQYPASAASANCQLTALLGNTLQIADNSPATRQTSWKR